MIIQGTTIDVEFDINVPKNGGGTYLGTTLTYKDKDGKVLSKSWAQGALNHTANAHIKAALQTLTKGTNFEAEIVKKDGFNNWVELKIVSAASNVTPINSGGGGGFKPEASTQRTWQGETPEERAERRALDKQKFEFEKEKQKLIIRQSSLSSAVAFISSKGLKDKVTSADVIAMAKEFEAYVLNDGIDFSSRMQGTGTDGLIDLVDDYPL